MNTLVKVDKIVMCTIHHIVLTQMGTKRGIIFCRNSIVYSIFKEMKQIYGSEVVLSLNPYDTTYEIQRKVPAYIIFLKMKQIGEIKARGCADGRLQRVYKTNEEILTNISGGVTFHYE